MDTTDIYLQFDEDEEQPKTLLGRFLGCLHAYTIGSCYYGGAGVSQFDNGQKDGFVEMRMASNGLVGNGAVHDHKEQESRQECNICLAEIEMKAKLQHHFKSHIGKWTDKKRRRFPWKIILHIVLLLLITTQFMVPLRMLQKELLPIMSMMPPIVPKIIPAYKISIYAVEKFRIAKFWAENTDAFNFYFIESESDRLDVKLYKLKEIYAQIEHVVEAYYNIANEAVSSFFYYANNTPSRSAEFLRMTIDYRELEECFYQQSNFYPFNNQRTIVSRKLYRPTTNTTENTPCNSTEPCCTSDDCNRTVTNQVILFINRDNIDRIQKITFDFTLSTAYYKGVIEDYSVIDVLYNVKVIFNNDLRSSSAQVNIELNSQLRRYCRDAIRPTTILDVIAIVFLIINLLVYLRSLVNTLRLSKEVKLYFAAYHGKRLGLTEISALFNKWYILAFIACILLVIATALKIIADYQEFVSFSLIQSNSVFFACGFFMLWCGLFGFLKYFESLNVMLITINLALPSVLRFAICMLLLFAVFVLCGWLVMGPYNAQFADPFITTENLVSFLNGDGIAGAFSAVQLGTDTVTIFVAIFNKIYLIVFVFVYLYIIVSLFIGIFAKAYDTLSKNWTKRSHGFVWDWAEIDTEDGNKKTYPFPLQRVHSAPKDDDTPATQKKKCHDMIYVPPYAESDAKIIVDSPNDLELSIATPNAKVRASTCTDEHHQNEHHDESKLREHRHYTADSNLLEELNNASRREITRARATLRVRKVAAHVSSVLEESDV